MRTLCLLLLTVLVCAASGCGGGSASNAGNAPAFKVDLSTPEGATDAYAWAMENMDETVAGEVYATAEREASLESFRENCKKWLTDDLTWKLSFEQATQVEEKGQAQVLVTFMPVHKKKGEQPDGAGRKWVVIVREADNKWRVSRNASDERNVAAGWPKGGIPLNPPKPPANAPQPAGNASPPANGG